VSGADGLVLDAGAAPAQPDLALAVTPAAAVAVTAAATSSAGAQTHAPALVAHADGADGLTRAFSKQQPQVQKCFTAHASDVTGSPELAIRFGVDTAGHVTSAQVLPPAIASTPLGACLATVAQATRFAPQAHEISFRIPITAHALAQ
jgi:hypothetical protein